MVVKVRHLKPGMILGDMGSLIESIEVADVLPDSFWGSIYKVKVAQMEKPFETYGEMEFECYWPPTS